jgi:hypothetical protein
MQVLDTILHFMLGGSLFLYLAACGHKTGKQKGEHADPAAFFNSFQPLTVPLQITDSIFIAKQDDQKRLEPNDVSAYMPDSLFTDDEDIFGQIKFYPYGRIQTPKGETYLFLLAYSGTDKKLYLAGFDRLKKLVDVLPALSRSKGTAIHQAFMVEKNLTLTRKSTRKNADGSLSTGKNVYALNEATRKFTLVMTDALDEKPVELVNPIDTLPRKFKFSADYSKDKRNLVSIRDGSNAGKLYFFIHFEKNNGDCSGELRGTAQMNTVNSAIYQQPGDPCTLNFGFSTSAVNISEQNCGSHRGLNCLFEGSFPRRKEPVKPKNTVIKKPHRR